MNGNFWKKWFRAFVVAVVLAVPAEALAQNDAGVSGSAADVGVTVGDLRLVPSGAVETVYSWNTADPSNGVNNFRLNDARSRTFTLSLVMAALEVSYGALSARLAIQFGHVPETYYLAEPARLGGGGVGDTGPGVWKYIQEAYLGLAAGRLGVHCGLFLSPVGPEGMTTTGANNTAPGAESPNASNGAISRPFEFYGLPFFHTGCRVTGNMGRGFTGYAWVVNGWNSVGADNNGTPSGIINLQYASPRFSWSLLAMGGSERALGAAEGPGWRWLFDSWGQLHFFGSRLSFVVQVNGGFEPNRYGMSGWFVGSLGARWHFHRTWYVAARGGYFREWIGANSDDPERPIGAAAPIFWPAQAGWMSSGTFTLGYRPHRNALVRLEYRRDGSGGNVFYAGPVEGDGSAARPYLPNADGQDTLTLGLNAWF